MAWERCRLAAGEMRNQEHGQEPECLVGTWSDMESLQSHSRAFSKENQLVSSNKSWVNCILTLAALFRRNGCVEEGRSSMKLKEGHGFSVENSLFIFSLPHAVTAGQVEPSVGFISAQRGWAERENKKSKEWVRERERAERGSLAPSGRKTAGAEVWTEMGGKGIVALHLKF